MGFFRVKASEENTIIVNRDCGVRVVLDYLKIRLGITDTEVELDLCDEWGNVRFLSQAPPRCNTIHLLAPRGLYTPVVITQMPTLKFEFPMGKPVTIHRLRDAQRKARRQWGKLQKLLGSFSGQFDSDEEAVETIYQVVGSPSADYGKGKVKGRDPAPKSPRSRSISAGKKKKASWATDISESKENTTENGQTQPERPAVSAGRETTRTRRVSISDERNEIEATEAENKSSMQRRPLNNVESKGTHGLSQDYGVDHDKTAGLAGRRGSTKYENNVPEIPANKSKDVVKGQEHEDTSKTTPASTKPAEAEESGKAAEEAPEVPKSSTSTTDKDKTPLPAERPAHESTDSGIESAASRSGGRVKDSGMRETSSDAQSASGEAGSNEDSPSAPTLPLSKTRLKHRRSSRMPAIPEQVAPANSGVSQDEAPAKSEAYDENQQSRDRKTTSSGPSDATNITNEKDVTRGSSNAASIDASQPTANAVTAEPSVGESSSPGAPRPPQDPSSPTASGAVLAPEDIAGVAVSIVPPSAAAPHRRSVDVTALLGIPVTDGTPGAEADPSTGHGVPSMIDEEWRRAAATEQLMGVLSATSRLVYLGSARSQPVDVPQINVVNTTEEQAQRLSSGSLQLAAAGPGEERTRTDDVGGERGDVTSQPDTWRSPSGGAVET